MEHSKIFELLKNIDAAKTIDRRITHKDYSKENDAEHMYCCATYVMALDELIPPEIDRYKVIQLLLVHDLVEVIHGDTWYFASQEEKDAKKSGELAAAKTLFKDNQKFMDLWLEYEARKTPESIIAKQIDIIQAVSTIVLHDGITWGITKVTQEREMQFSEWIYQNKTPLGDFLTYIFNYADAKNLFYQDERN